MRLVENFPALGIPELETAAGLESAAGIIYGNQVIPVVLYVADNAKLQPKLLQSFFQFELAVVENFFRNHFVPTLQQKGNVTH